MTNPFTALYPPAVELEAAEGYRFAVPAQVQGHDADAQHRLRVEQEDEAHAAQRCVLCMRFLVQVHSAGQKSEPSYAA